MTSYYGLDMHKYTSFQASNVLGDIRDLLTIDANIFALTADSLIARMKYGQVLYRHVYALFMCSKK